MSSSIDIVDDYKVSSSYLWSFIQHWSSRVISLSTFFVLARVLDPHDFGIVAVAAIFIGFAEIFVDQGFGDALVQRREITQHLLNTAFYSNMLMSLVSAAFFYSIAPFAAAYFSIASLTPVLRVMCLSFIFTGLSAVQTSMLRREGKFRSLTIRTIAANGISGVVAIWCALDNFGVWALVSQQIVYSAVAFVALWVMGTFRPGFSVSWVDFRSLLSFGTKITSVRVLDYSHTKSVDWLVGGIFGPVAVGIYSVGTRLGLILTQLLGASMSDASLTHFSRIQHDRKEVYDFLELTAQRVASISGSMFALLALNAGPIIDIVFGHKWEASAPIFAAFCTTGTLQALTYICVPLISALGRPGINLAISATKLVFIVTSVFIFSRFGMTYIAWAVSAGSMVFFVPATIVVATRTIGLTPWRLVARLGVVYFTIIAGSAASALATWHIHNSFLRIIVSGVTYATLFVALNLMLRTQFSRLLRLSLRRLNKFRIVRSIIDKYRGIADHSFDKNRRYSLTNFLYPSVELSFYRPEARYHAVNFGDELSLITVGLMLARRGATIFDCTDRPRQLVAVGSVLHMAREGATIWGTGVHGSVPDFGHVYHKLDVRAVRGPLTRRFLQQRGIQVPEIYGDPGLLVPILTAGRFAVTGEYEVGFVPNFHDREHLDAQQFGKRFPDINIIDPLRAWNLVIADILKCKFVMASSLHGIVTAESFGIPARYVRLTEHEALLKYEDYFEGTGRPVSFASSVEQALDMGGIALGGYDPAPLLAAFPYDLWNLA